MEIFDKDSSICNFPLINIFTLTDTVEKHEMFVQNFGIRKHFLFTW